MMQNKKYKLLSNIPCGEDRFEGKSHERIAAHIADVLRNDNNMRIIGIEGGWGSGKSNLVRLVEKNLNCNDNGKSYKFFTYDAWGHITDFQRRSILEELTDFLIDDLQPSDKWQDKKIKLLSKSKTTETRDIPKINGFLAMFVIIILATPIINAIFSTFPESWNTQGQLGWIKAFMYFILICIGILWSNDQKRFEKKGEGEESLGTLSLSDLFAVYAKKVNSTTTYEQIHDEEPSSREFRDWIEDINKSLPQDEVVVLVFDNMDRLPKKKVQEFWAAIHSFFSSDTEVDFSRLRVIIPFDRLHVNEAFKKEDEDEKYGDDFINKTFNVVYSVPPIIMTQWKSYFSAAWKEAFGVDSPVEVTQIFDYLNNNKTPREIIAFINQCVTIKQTNPGIDDNYIALYIFGKASIVKDPVKEILNPSFLGSLNKVYEHDEDLSANLSALYYQLTAYKAVDVVLSSKIVRELNNNTPDVLRTNGKNEDFLIRLLENSIPQVTNIENAVRAFSSLNLSETYKKTSLWTCLCEVALNSNEDIFDYKPYQFEVFKHSSQRKQYFAKLVNGYIKNVDNIKGENYKTAIDHFYSFDSDVVEDYFNSHTFEVNPDKYLEILKASRENIGNYGVTCGFESLDKYLGEVDINALRQVRGIDYILEDDKKPEEQLPKYVSNLKKLLDSNKSNADNLLTIYCHYKELFRPIDPSLWLTDAEIFNLKNSTKKDHLFYYDIVAMRIARLGQYATNYRSAFDSILKSEDATDIKGLATCIEYYICYGDLLLNISSINYPLIKAVIKELTLNRHGSSRMSISETLTHFDGIVQETGIDSKDLFKRTNDWSEYYSQLGAEEISIPLLIEAKNSDLELAIKIKGNVESIYSAATQEEWEDSILNHGHLVDMWLEYHPNNVQNCFDAYKSVLKDNATTGEVNIAKEYADELLSIFISFKDDVQYLFMEIYNILKGHNSKGRLLYYGGWILKYCPKEMTKTFLADLVPTDIVDKGVTEFLLSHPESLKTVMPQGFMEKLQQLSENQMKDNEDLSIFLANKKSRKSKKVENTKEPD